MNNGSLFIRGIKAIFNFCLKAHSEGTEQSSKRLYGGILIINAIFMAWFDKVNCELLLYSGIGLLASSLLGLLRKNP